VATQNTVVPFPSEVGREPVSAGQLTLLLRAWTRGDDDARDRLAGLVYDDLRKLARARLRARPRQSLCPSDVVNNAFVRLLGQEARWVNRAHFYAVAAEMIRRVLVDHARARLARKRGGAAVRVELGEVDLAQGPKGVDLIALDQVLDDLAAQDPRQARLVELRYFGGLTFEEIAEELGRSASSVKRDWEMARLWLLRRLREGESRRGPGQA
jgi:RNA polymerase sigma factor (TIGR02999 family)